MQGFREVVLVEHDLRAIEAAPPCDREHALDILRWGTGKELPLHPPILRRLSRI